MCVCVCVCVCVRACVCVCVCMRACVCCQMAMFQDEGAVESLVLLVILSVPVGVLWGYAASFAFRRPRTCLALMPLLTVLVGNSFAIIIVMPVVVSIIHQRALCCHHS